MAETTKTTTRRKHGLASNIDKTFPIAVFLKSLLDDENIVIPALPGNYDFTDYGIEITDDDGNVFIPWDSVSFIKNSDSILDDDDDDDYYPDEHDNRISMYEAMKKSLE